MSSTPNPPNLPPFNPANRNDPRYDPRLDPSNDPRWQQQQAKTWARTAKAQANAQREQQRFAARQQRDYLRAQARQQRDARRAYQRINRAPSVIGPLTLIAVASVVLLVHNGRLTFGALLNWYSRWWPALLIGFGVLRLAEWGIDRASRRADQPPVRYSLGGGVVALLIFVSLLGVAAQGGLHHNGDQWTLGFTDGDTWKQFLGSKHEQDTPAATHAIGAAGALVIDNPRGDVTVAGTSDDGLLHLSTHKEVFTSSDGDARNRLDELEPQFSGSGENLALRVNGHENDSVDLTVLVPSGVRVSVNANRGDVKVSNFKAATSVTANRGDVDIAAITGAATVRVNSRNKSVLAHSIEGSVDVQGTGDEINLTDINGPVHVSGDFFGGGHLQHITGPMDYGTTRITFNLASLDGEVTFDDHDEFSARDAAGPFTLKTRSRDLTLTRISGNINVTNSHGKVDLSAIPPGGTITVDNHDGDIRLSLPQQARFTLAAETSDGDVSSNFSVAGSNGTHGVLNGTIAGGGTAVRLTTTHGDIAVDHSGDASPTPPRTPRVPMKLGFGSVPAPPPVPGALPQEAQEAIAQAREQVREAQQQASEAARNGRQQGDEARRQADQIRRDTLQAAAESLREAQQQGDQARREARQQADEARRQGDQARREALQQAAEQRREAQQQAAEARREAKQEADAARREAQQKQD